MSVDWQRALVHQLTVRGNSGRHSERRDIPRGTRRCETPWHVVRLGDVLVLDQPVRLGRLTQHSTIRP